MTSRENPQLGKWTPREKYVKYENIPKYFGLLSFPECSGEISRKFVESAYPINALKVEVFHLKIMCEIFACKGS